MTPSRHSIRTLDEYEQTSKPNSPALPNLDTDVFASDDSRDQKPSFISPAELETASAATEPLTAEPARSTDSTTIGQRQQSNEQADTVVLNLGPSSKELVYEFNKSGILVGFPHKIEPSVTLQTRWNDEIEPRLWHDVEAFKRRTKPVVRRGRVVFPGLSVELRMSGRVGVGASQVTLVPTVWFLYDNRKWERDTRRFVADLEWLSGEGFGAPEVHKGAPRLSTLHIPAKHLQLSASAYDSISLPGGDELYIHVEEPQHGTACGLLCCATFVHSGDVSTQYLSRIGGLLNLDARTAAITTAHGFVEEIFSRVDLCDIDDMTNSDEQPQSDDEEPPEPHSSVNNIGHIDSEALETMSWVQLPPTSIQETCFFRTQGSSMEEILSGIKDQHSYERSIVLGEKPWPTARSGHHRGSQTGDFSVLGLDDRNGLYNYYQCAGDSTTLEKKMVYKIAEPGEVDGGRATLLLRPEKSSQAVLLPGTILFATNGVTLHAHKIILERPLGWLHPVLLV